MASQEDYSEEKWWVGEVSPIMLVRKKTASTLYILVSKEIIVTLCYGQRTDSMAEEEKFWFRYLC